MSGWVFVNNRDKTFKRRVEKFITLFDNIGEYPLYTKEIKIDPENIIIIWGWGKYKNFNDATFYYDKNFKQVIFIDGVITDLGAYGDSHTDQVLTAKRVLELWNLYKESFIMQINGSFSITIFNKKAQEVICISDRIGSRTIWYSKEKGINLFGNFPLALAAFRDTLTLDGAALWSMIAASRPISDRNLFYEIRSIQAGQIAYFNSGQLPRFSRWFELKYDPDFSLSKKEWGARIADNLRVSAEKIVKFSSKPYLFLSGGMDSRVAAAVFGDKINSVTLISSPNVSSRIAERVAKSLNIPHQTVVREPYWYLNTFMYAALTSGGIYNITHAHFFNAMRLINSEKKMSFTLGDMLENFNKHYFKDEIIGKFNPDEELCLPEIFNKLYSYSHKDFTDIQRLFISGTGEKIYESWASKLNLVFSEVKRVSENNEDRFDALFRWYNIIFCPTNLMHESIKPFAELRNLMFDNSVLSDLFTIPYQLKSKGIIHKNILRYSSKKMLLIPNSNFWLPPIMPQKLNRITGAMKPVIGKVRRRVFSTFTGKGKLGKPITTTTGSWHMLHEWYRKDKRYRDFIWSKISDKNSLPEEIFDKRAVVKYWKEFQSGDISKMFIINMLLTFSMINEKFPSNRLKL